LQGLAAVTGSGHCCHATVAVVIIVGSLILLCPPHSSLWHSSGRRHCLYGHWSVCSSLPPYKQLLVAEVAGAFCHWRHTGAATDAGVRAGALADILHGSSYLQTIGVARFLGS